MSEFQTKGKAGQQRENSPGPEVHFVHLEGELATDEQAVAMLEVLGHAAVMEVAKSGLKGLPFQTREIRSYGRLVGSLAATNMLHAVEMVLGIDAKTLVSLLIQEASIKEKLDKYNELVEKLREKKDE